MKTVTAAVVLATAAAAEPPLVLDDVRIELAAHGQARVLLNLKDPVAIGAPLHVRRAAVAAAQSEVLRALKPEDFVVGRRYEAVPALAGVLTLGGLKALLARPPPALQSIHLDDPVHAHLAESIADLHADVVHGTLGLRGEGFTVAVLDTGAMAGHLDFHELDGGAVIIAQQCFTGAGHPDAGDADCLPADGGMKRSSSGPLAVDDDGHGTNVSGIIASRGRFIYAPGTPDEYHSHEGFAPAAKLVEVKVLSATSGWTSDWVAGFDWIITNQSTLNVSVINASLGTFKLYAPGNAMCSADCDCEQVVMKNAVAQLNALGVMVFASAGNDGAGVLGNPTPSLVAPAMAAPACVAGVVAVGAVFDSELSPMPSYWSGTPGDTWRTFIGTDFPALTDPVANFGTITRFTNRSTRLDLLAPGSAISATGVDVAHGSIASIYTYHGTSQASPTAAGVAVLLRQKTPTATPAQILAALKSSGTMIHDSNTGLDFPRIDALAAIQTMCVPRTSCPATQHCGVASDLCGGVLMCGTCNVPQTCGGGGDPNACGCAPVTACPGGQNCGAISDGCGSTLDCGSCVAPQTCVQNHCGCTPKTSCPAGQTCGTADDGCGGTVNCGTCSCTPTTDCQPGQNCGSIDDGCGGTINCGVCTAPDVCAANHVCSPGVEAPQTCGCATGPASLLLLAVGVLLRSRVAGRRGPLPVTGARP